VRVRDDLALVLTTDFFTPIVDDPETFGAIAATNSLSDVYAMGGEPMFALSIAGFPTKTLPLEILTAILRGGQEKAREAGCLVVGGHTIDDAEPKYGLAVVGTIRPDRILTKGGARPGDRLILTKAIGTGVVATAIKREQADPTWVDAAVRSMTTLNRDAARAAVEAGVVSMTDVTGFGLLGHLLEMLRAGGLGARIDSAAVPLLPGARELAEKGVVPGGTKSNAEFVAPDVDFAETVAPWLRTLLADAQTSGGLLVALPEAAAEAYRSRVPSAADVGAFVAGPPRVGVV
jgi:selenide,water dikinase